MFLSSKNSCIRILYNKEICYYQLYNKNKFINKLTLLYLFLKMNSAYIIITKTIPI